MPAELEDGPAEPDECAGADENRYGLQELRNEDDARDHLGLGLRAWGFGFRV